MAFKFVALAALFGLARAGAPLGYAAPALSYAAPAISYAAAAPALSYHAPSVARYAAPAIASYAAPAIASYAAPVATYAAPVAKAVIAQPYAPPNYDFAYGVNDPHTGDVKQQQESRRGDVVQGSYSLIDSDGTRRVVEYAADDHNGFNAIVRKEPLAVKTIAPVATAVAAPIASYAAPIAASYAAPALGLGYSGLGYSGGYGYSGLGYSSGLGLGYSSGLGYSKALLG